MADDEVTERIVAAALRRFAEVGYGSATVDDIAAAAGVGVATLYRRWPDKPALANALLANYLDAVEAIAEPIAGGTPKQRFLRQWRRYWTYAAEHPDELAFGAAHAHAGFATPELAARKAALAVRLAEQLADVGVTAPPELAAALVSASLTAALPLADRLDADDLGERLWAALRLA